MKITFITFAPLSSSSGHLARFATELRELSNMSDISILCLGERPDDGKTKKDYKRIHFYHIPARFNGWRVLNVSKILRKVDSILRETSQDLIILQMEVWDLVRELNEMLKDRLPFSVIFHAMPFLGSPIKPSRDFEHDVLKFCSGRLERFKKNYIIERYKEAKEVLNSINVIANNKTISFYLRNYFDGLKIWDLNPSPVVRINNNLTRKDLHYRKLRYDFVYMARMEAGKGIEYLSDILVIISSILNRPISVAILGRTDDKASKKALENLLGETRGNRNVSIDFYGWAGIFLKNKILSKSGVFLYPSHYDNYPTVVNEALAAGVPCITWKVPFYRLNYFHRTEAVIGTPIFDCKQFAFNAVAALHNRKTLGLKALDFINSFDSQENIAKSDLRVFSDIVKDYVEFKTKNK